MIFLKKLRNSRFSPEVTENPPTPLQKVEKVTEICHFLICAWSLRVVVEIVSRYLATLGHNLATTWPLKNQKISNFRVSHVKLTNMSEV